MRDMASVDNKAPTDSSRADEASPGTAYGQYMLAAAAAVGITLPALFLQRWVGHRAVALIYLMAVVILALFIGRGPTLFAATLSVVSWDFFSWLRSPTSASPALRMPFCSDYLWSWQSCWDN